eukprot:106760-Rhodomonas_salina.2
MPLTCRVWQLPGSRLLARSGSGTVRFTRTRTCESNARAERRRTVCTRTRSIAFDFVGTMPGSGSGVVRMGRLS